MKQIRLLIITSTILTIVMMLCSCSTTEKFRVTAPNGTSIYIPSNTNTPVAVSSGNESVKVEVPCDNYYGYLIARDPITGIEAPFGLNVKKKVRFWEKIVTGTTLTLGIAGTGAAIIGLATSTEVVTGAGFAGALSLMLGMPADSRLRQLTHAYQFTYLPSQNISFDGMSAKLINPDLPKEVYSVATSTVRPKATSGEKKSTHVKSSQARKSHSDLGKKVEGIYAGTGQLLKGKNVEESYSNILLKIERVDKNHVNVQIIESDEDFFSEPMEYIVENNKKDGWILKIEDIPSATIKIDKKGKARFEHQNVNIDDEIFTLIMTGNKKK